MAVTEMLLGERAEHGLANGITYDPQGGLLRGVVNGAIDTEPITQLRERFAKLKARDNLLGAVLARLGLKAGDADQAPEVLGRMLEDRMESATWADILTGAMSTIAKGLGLRDGGAMMKPDELAAQVLAMNTELAAALSSSQAEVKALTEENARIRTEVEQERGHKLHAMTAADIAISRSTEMEAEVRILKAKIAEADLERMLAEARLWGLASELQHLEVAMRKKLRA